MPSPEGESQMIKQVTVPFLNCRSQVDYDGYSLNLEGIKLYEYGS